MRVLIFLSIFLLTLSFSSPAHAKLQYFGYYFVNGLYPWVDYQDHIPEIGARGNSNIGVINVSVIDRLPKYLTEMRQYHMYAVLDVTAQFEDYNREANWTKIKTAIKGHEDVVYGFYFDESVWRGIGVDRFRSFTSQIRADFPDKATILVEGLPPIINGTIPEGYLDYITDIGFDHYPTVTMESVSAFDKEWQGYQWYYHVFSKYTAGKKVWLVPDGYGYSHVPTHYLATVLQKYYEHAIAHPEVVGMLVFRYDPGDESTVYTVQDTMNPSSKFYDTGVVYTHNSVGRAILADAPPYPVSSPSPSPTPSPTPKPSPKSGDLNSDSKVNLLDFNLLVSKFRNPYTLLNFNAIITNYGK